MQYADGLRTADIDLQLWSFFSDADIPRWFGRSHAGRVLALSRGLGRLYRARRLTKTADLVWVLRDAVPFGVPWLDRLLIRRRPWVWDVDDAVWRHSSPTAGRLPTWLRATPAKYAALCRGATEVWAGSEVLAAWCRERATRVIVVPTVVDVPPSRTESAASTDVACWIGSHSTTPFIAEVLPALLDGLPQLRVVIVGADTTKVTEHPRLEMLPWSPATEEAVLRDSAVGLYPVDTDHPLADGKCGLKAILYMANGVAPVVTPTLTNAVIVRAGVDGLHATDDASWIDAVSRLLVDAQLREACSRSGRARALKDYSLQTWTPRVVSLIEALVARP
jgi:glycosyltransferase involved in cell wall biosynthesis